MDWTISPDLVRIVSPLALAHSAIGLGIVGVVMWMRTDATLKLFGVGIGLFAIALAVAAITTGIRPPEDSIRWFGLLGAVLTLATVLIFLRVGIEDYSDRMKTIAMVLGVVWGVVALGMEFVLDDGAPASYSEAGFIVTSLHPLTAMWIIVGLVFAFFEAAHITVEHSHGEPYRSVLLIGMSIMALSIVITMIADQDALRFINTLVGTSAAGILWIAVVVHERKEIAREHGVAGV